MELVVSGTQSKLVFLKFRRTIHFSDEIASVADEKGVGLKGWLSGPRRKTPIDQPGIEKLVPLDKHRIAVLPITNISPDPRDEYFAEGMTDELIATISKIPELHVIARTSSVKYKGSGKGISEISQELRIGSILEGTVRTMGNQLRVTAQLIDSQTEENLWSESYDRELDDVFDIQTDIARNVAEGLKIQLHTRHGLQFQKKPTANTEAHVFYLKGRFHWNTRSEEGINKAMRFFEDAVAKDLRYALAYVGLADCYVMLGVYCYREPGTVFPKAKDLAAKALAIDNSLAEAHASMFEILAHFDFDWAKASSEIEEAIELNPSYAQAHAWYGSCYLASHGRFDEALAENR